MNTRDDEDHRRTCRNRPVVVADGHQYQGVELDMSRHDLGHPQLPGLWSDLHGHCRVGTLRCASCGRWLYLQERAGVGRIVCGYTAGQITAHQNESDEHRALKELVATAAERAGLTPMEEDRAGHGKRITDVRVTGGRADVGWEIQLSPITSATLKRRVARAESDGIVPSWLALSGTAVAKLIDYRAPLSATQSRTALEYLALQDVPLTGVRTVQVEECTGKHKTEKWHRGQPCSGRHSKHVPLIHGNPTLARMVEGTAAQTWVPVRWPRPVGGRDIVVWLTPRDRDRMLEVDGLAPQRSITERPADLRARTGYHVPLTTGPDESPAAPDQPPLRHALLLRAPRHAGTAGHVRAVQPVPPGTAVPLMVWFRTDDSFPSHPKVRSIPRANRMRVVGTWLACGAWSAHHLTDGRVPADVVLDEGGKAVDAGTLVTVGLWHRDGHGCERCPQPGAGAYQFHDWSEYQKTREQVMAERKKTADRVADFRKKRRNTGGNAVTPDEPTDQYDPGNEGGNGVTPSLVTMPPARTRPEKISPDGDISSALALRPDDRPDVERVCRHLADRIEANGSRRPAIGKGWHDAARLLIDRDQITEAQIHAAIDWCQADDFWRSNILSMPKLREKYDQLRLAATRPQGRSANGSGHRVSPGDRALMLAQSYAPGSETG
jgi:hypothetical protein